MEVNRSSGVGAARLYEVNTGWCVAPQSRARSWVQAVAPSTSASRSDSSLADCDRFAGSLAKQDSTRAAASARLGRSARSRGRCSSRREAEPGAPDHRRDEQRDGDRDHHRAPLQEAPEEQGPICRDKQHREEAGKKERQGVQQGDNAEPRVT
jgi:hypothetical protein